MHAKLLQKEKEIMSINYTATLSMNYTTLELIPGGQVSQFQSRILTATSRHKWTIVTAVGRGAKKKLEN